MKKLTLKKIAFATLIGATMIQGCGSSTSKNVSSTVKDEVDPHGSDLAIKVAIHAPAARALPDYAGAKPTIVIWCLTGPTCPNGASTLIEVKTADISPREIRTEQKPLANQSTYAINMDYRSSGNSSIRRFRAAEGQVVGSVLNVDIHLKRIDVRHMQITRPNGTSYEARGSAEIREVKSPTTDDLVATIETGSGLDVLSNKRYKIIVSAVGEDGPKRYTSYLDFTQ